MTDIQKRLYALADPKYQAFHSSLCPGVSNIIGVRTPLLRTLAKELAKGDFRTYLATATDTSYEEILLQGLVIGYGKMPLEERFSYIAGFVPKIDNWATCDLFCSTLTFAKKQREAVWEFLLPYLSSSAEFPLRFGVVMLLDHFLTDTYIDAVLERLNTIHHDGYYVKMAIAWAISICYIKFPEQTMVLLRNNHLDDFTYNKALQKIRESTRVSATEKEALQKMKRSQK